MGDWYREDIKSVAERLNVNPSTGLSSDEAQERVGKFGPNALVEGKKEHRAIKFAKQFIEFMILVLIGSALIALALGEVVDALAILAIVLLNGVIGFLQEEKAEKVIENLKKLSSPSARVLRSGSLAVEPAQALVPGDVIYIEAGDVCPADARLIEANFLKIHEAALTGESQPVDKASAAITEDLPLADRVNMLYSGTTAVYGKGVAIVTETGMSTEIGKIARLLASTKPEPTPLQRRLSELGRKLVYAAGAICALIFVLGVLRGEGYLQMFLTAVSLAVAAIPEGLPAVVTIVLAIGVQKMVKRHALVRKLPSVETLGSATIIASDKTGTITQNQMTVRKVYLGKGGALGVSGAGYSPVGEFYSGASKVDPASNEKLLLLAKCALLCNGAELGQSSPDEWRVIGDPTEGALLTFSQKAGLLPRREFLAKEGIEQTGEVPFDSERKMMTVVFRAKDGTHHVFVKGAVEKVLRLCDRGPESDGADFKGAALKATDEFSSEALRVLAFAYKKSATPLGIDDVEGLEDGLEFLGLVGMIDPPREEVFAAIEKARTAGITSIMITGDHKATAIAVAREIDLYRQGDEAVTGEDLDRMSEDEFRRMLPHVKVYARTNPEHKLRIVRAWRERGDIIAMTGDGVNDAPALKEADIGIAMGITGTEVTKEASDMVLTNDNFASIVTAVEEGRGIFDNIRRVVHFLLSCNIGEIFVLLCASLLGMPLPLLPVQILWTNLVTDGLPALGLAMEKVDSRVMERPPRRKGEGIITGQLLVVMLIQGALMSAVTLGVYALELYVGGSSLEKARTMAFTVLVLCQKFHVYNCRSTWDSAFKGVFSNKTLNIAVAVIIVTQVLLIYVPALEEVFEVVPLNANDWALVIGASIMPLLVMEVVKAVKRSVGGGKGRVAA